MIPQARVKYLQFAVLVTVVLAMILSRDVTDFLNHRARIDIQSQAEKFCRRFIKYPDDAVFSETTSEFSEYYNNYHQADQSWLIQGKVLTKNAFGAQLTYRWRATLVLDDENKWQCVLFFFDNKIVHSDLQSSF